jgi:large subunit ribosomal protein L13
MNHTYFIPAPKRVITLDATGEPLGRLASKIAKLLRGKDLPIYSYKTSNTYIDIVNFSLVKINPTHEIFRHTMTPKNYTAHKIIDYIKIRPLLVLQWVVRGMMPKNKTRHILLRRLNVN